MTAPSLDPRRHAVRDDLADARLDGRVEAQRFVHPVRRQVAAPLAGCRRRPDDHAPLETEFLHGEDVDVFDVADGWCWSQSTVDGYVGYVREDALGESLTATRRVSVPLALVFPEPSIKVPPLARLPMGSRLAADAMVTAGTERFHPAAGGFVLAQHTTALDAFAADWVAVAEGFLGAPYLWGGRTWDGIDCSALIQVALNATGRAAPRDSDMQCAELGEQVAADQPMQRGDLLFWRGHAGIMLDAERLLHANGYHHVTAIEPVAGTLARLEALGLPLAARRRLS